jgi:Tfp pilus assembly protein PilF/CheY-like chemotaxis protein
MPSKRVLVVDPSAQAHEAIAEIFKLRGDDVVFAKDEPEALSIFKPGAFDLVLTEVLLPRGSGYTLCREARRIENAENPPVHTPVLIMSTIMRNIKFAMEAKKNYGADETLVKPFDAHDLRRKLAFFLDKRNADKEDLAEVDYWEGPFDGKPRVRLYVEPLRASGRLSRVPFARVFGAFAQLGETGVLHAKSGSVHKTFHFQEGRLVFVSGGNRRERLTWLLVRAARLNRDAAMQALSSMRASGRKLGETLLEGRQIDPHELYQLLQTEMEEKALNCFRWTSGDFWFEPAVRAAPRDATPTTLDVFALMRRGIEEHYSAAALLREFELWNASVARVNPLNAAAFEKMRPNRAERRIWDKLKAGERVRDIIDESGLEPVAAQRFLFALLCLDFMILETAPNLPSIPRNLLTPAGDPVFRAEIADRFAKTFSKPLDQLLAPENAAAVYDPDRKHVDACRSLFHKRLFPNVDPLTRVRAEAVFARLEEAHTATVGRSPERRTAEPVARERAQVLEAELIFQQGLQALADGKFMEAGDSFRTAVEFDDATADYHAHLGYALYKQETDSGEIDPTAALASLNRALELDCHLPEAHVFLGVIYRRLGQENRAEESFARALRFDPENRAALQQLREIFAARGADAPEPSGAPAAEEARRRIKEFFAEMQHDNFFEALDVARNVVGRDLQKAYFDRAASFRGAENSDALDPLTREQAEEIFHLLTVAYSTLGNPEARAKYLVRLADEAEVEKKGPASDADKQMAGQLFQRGERALQKKEYKAAVEQFDSAWRLDPTDARRLAYFGWADFLLAAQTPGEEEAAGVAARDHLRRALAIDPRCADAHLFLGNVYWRENKRHLAREQFDHAVSVAPDNLDALKACALAHLPADAAVGVTLYQPAETEPEKIYVALAAHLDDLAAKDYFDVLGVGFNVGRDEAKKAYDAKYAELLTWSDPQQLPPDARFRAGEIRARLDRAYRVLADDHLRACCLNAVSDQPKLKAALPPEATPLDAPGAAKPPAGETASPPPGGKPEKPAKPEKTAKPEKPAKPEKTAKPEKPAKPNQAPPAPRPDSPAKNAPSPKASLFGRVKKLFGGK